MRKLIVFEQLTLDGYFSGPNGDISWAHLSRTDPEWNAFAAENASGGGGLIFGRVTYEMMVKYWPTPAAKQNQPQVAEGMNRLPKFVFSRTLKEAAWSNTTIVKGDLPAEIRKLQEASGQHLAILGSGSLVNALAPSGLVDEYQFVIYPVAIGKGRPLFEGIKEKLELKLTRSRTFKNGNTLLCYEPS